MLNKLAILLHNGTKVSNVKHWKSVIKKHGAWFVHHSQHDYIAAIVIDWECQYEKQSAAVILALVVHPEWQHQNIGKMLMVYLC